MTAHEALLMAEEQILKARQKVLDNLDIYQSAFVRTSLMAAEEAHKEDAKIVRAIRESLPK